MKAIKNPGSKEMTSTFQNICHLGKPQAPWESPLSKREPKKWKSPFALSESFKSWGTFQVE
jgi:hypothetical protein